ncbi:MAG: hypothetical protein M1832_002818 [Thelocarpon impressellum]|nr:MAG: hypothetical protein M1832_002818 [Thelocarpon impressellum]
MGASDSKLVFKKGIFRLSEDKDIAADDPYWTSFWRLPESTEDVFTLFSPADIRRTRDSAPTNLETLILAVTSRLFTLRDHPSFPDPDLAPEREALNCIRVLTRLLPFVYEADHLEAWEDRFFWGTRRRRTRDAAPADGEVLFDESKAEDERDGPRTPVAQHEQVKPLAEELLDTLTDLLFYANFTLPRPRTGKAKVSYTIWQSGVGCNTAVASSKEYESNRCEVLRLLLTMTSKSMYMSANALPVKGTKALTYITTCPDKQIVLSVLCSLLNTTLKYNPVSWRVPYDHVVYKDPRQVLVTYALQLLLVILLYPIPDGQPSTQPTKNYYRHFLGRLHRAQDFQFLVDGMTKILNQPVQANASYLPGSKKSLEWAPEMIMLFWEMLQCNKRFRAFIIDTDRAHDFVILVLFYALEQRSDPSRQGVVRMCVLVLQTLSAEPSFGRGLNKKFEGQGSLPTTVRVQGFNGSYADYLILSIYTLITASNGKLKAIYPALLAIINNIAAYVENLSASASSKLLQLFTSMSSPSFLLANDSNHALLASLLESLNAVVEHQYGTNANLVYAMLRSKTKFEALRTFTLESGQEQIERQNRRRKEQPRDLDLTSSTRGESFDGLRSPSGHQMRTPTLGDVPEESSAFAIGDDEDSDDGGDAHPTPSQSSVSPHDSRRPSVASSVEDAVPLQLRGMSEKARGKRPAGTPAFSRQSSSTSLGSHSATLMPPGLGFAPSAQWIETWLPQLPLHTVLTLIQELSPEVSRSSQSGDSHAPSVLQTIRGAEIRGIDPSPVRVHLFEWSPLSLGWYESLLWGLIFAGEMHVSKGTVGVWNGTAIKLFRVQETTASGPTLMAPRGAVDAVGSNIVQRIGSLNLRGGAGQGQADGQQPQQQQQTSGDAPVRVATV